MKGKKENMRKRLNKRKLKEMATIEKIRKGKSRKEEKKMEK